MPNIQMRNPDSLGKPLAAYSNVARVKASEFLFIAGQVGNNKDGKTPADFEGQCAQVFANIGAALASQGASFANVVAFTSYLVHSQDIPEVRPIPRARIPAAVRRRSPIRPTRCSLIDRLVREELSDRSERGGGGVSRIRHFGRQGRAVRGYTGDPPFNFQTARLSKISSPTMFPPPCGGEVAPSLFCRALIGSHTHQLKNLG